MKQNLIINKKTYQESYTIYKSKYFILSQKKAEKAEIKKFYLKND